MDRPAAEWAAGSLLAGLGLILCGACVVVGAVPALVVAVVRRGR